METQCLLKITVATVCQMFDFMNLNKNQWLGGTTGSASDQRSEGCGFEAY